MAAKTRLLARVHYEKNSKTALFLHSAQYNLPLCFTLAEPARHCSPGKSGVFYRHIDINIGVSGVSQQHRLASVLGGPKIVG